MKINSKVGILGFVISVAVITSTVLDAQPMDLDTPPGSPLWWTLTDDVSPQELRLTFRDEQAHLRRYLTAMEAGLAPPIAEQQTEALTFFIAPAQTPELVPLWIAFEVFGNLHLQRSPERVVEDRLSSHGVSSAGVATIVRTARAQASESKALSEETREDVLTFVSIQKEAVRDLGGGPAANRALESALERRDLSFFAGVSGLNESELGELYEQWRVNPPAQVARQKLPKLRAQLDEHDWEAFRRYLLENVAQGMGAFTDFDSVEVENR